MMTAKRVLRFLILAGAALGLLAACGADPTPTPRPTATPIPAAEPTATPDPMAEWNSIVAAAQEEGTVVVFGPPGDAVRRALTEGFEGAYPGIRVEWSGGRGGEQGAVIAEERKAGISSVDVVIQGFISFNRVFTPLNVLAPIEEVLYLPDVQDLSKWRNGELQIPPDGLNLGFTMSTNTQLIYDPEQVPDPTEIDEYHELLDPKWKGKIILNDPIPAGAGYRVLRDATEALGSIEAAEEWVRALKEQSVVDRDQRGMLESVLKGQYAIHFAPSGGVMGQLASEGIEFHYLTLKERTTPTYSNSFGTLMRMTEPPHLNAQIVFMNWLLTQEGQTAWSTSMNLGSLRLDVPTDHLRPYSAPVPGVEYGFDWSPLRTEEEEAIVNDIFGI